jgi:hypothetical protein
MQAINAPELRLPPARDRDHDEGQATWRPDAGAFLVGEYQATLVDTVEFRSYDREAELWRIRAIWAAEERHRPPARAHNPSFNSHRSLRRVSP